MSPTLRSTRRSGGALAGTPRTGVSGFLRRLATVTVVAVAAALAVTAPASAAGAERTYAVDSGGFIRYSVPTTDAPITYLDSDSLSGSYTIRLEDSSQYFGSHYYTVTEMHLTTGAGVHFDTYPGATGNYLVCFDIYGTCAPRIHLSVTGRDGLSSVDIQQTGFTGPDDPTWEGPELSPTGFDWTHANQYVNSYGMYDGGQGLVAEFRFLATYVPADTTAPTVTINAPQQGQTYEAGSTVTVSYGCVDPSGVASCLGDAPDGSTLSMVPSGGASNTFHVSATDSLGNSATSSVTYHVTDSVAPDITITSPVEGASYRFGQSVAPSYGCVDASTLPVASCSGPSTVATDTAGPHTYVVTSTDQAGNSTSASVSYDVLPPGSVTQAVSGGETVTTDPDHLGATATAPLQTTITVPAGTAGTVSVTPQPLGSSPTGYTLFGQLLVLEGPAATAATPYTVSFTIDKTALNGLAPADVQVFRNGVLVTGCTDPDAAVPDPCVVARGFVPNGGGDAVVTVRTSHFSQWSLGRLQYSFTGLRQPVDPMPTINTMKAGSAVPVKFGLGGDKGMNIFSAGYPTSTAVDCGSAASDDVEQTVATSTPSLSYDAASQQYSFVWKSDKSWRGCRDLVLKFRDGTISTARFNMR